MHSNAVTEGCTYIIALLTSQFSYHTLTQEHIEDHYRFITRITTPPTIESLENIILAHALSLSTVKCSNAFLLYRDSIAID